MSKIKVAFWGSTDLSKTILEGLYELQEDTKLELSYIVSNPAKPFGRKSKLTDNPVIQYCKEKKLNHYTPNSLTNFQPEEVDICFVAAYGKILPNRILNLAKYGFLNFHGSYLPKYRGATPVQTAILNQDANTGLTVIKMDTGMDTGDILYRELFSIQSTTTSAELMQEVAYRSKIFLINNWDSLLQHPEKWGLEKQNEEFTSYCFVTDFTKAKMQITQKNTYLEAHGKIMSANPEPIAWLDLSAKGKQKEKFDNSQKTENNNHPALIEKINLIRSILEDQEEIQSKINSSVQLATLKSTKTLSPSKQHLHHRRQNHQNGKNSNLTKQTTEVPLLISPNKKELYLKLKDGYIKILQIQPIGKKVLQSHEFINGYMTQA